MGKRTGRPRRGATLSPHQHMPSELAWQAWRLRRAGKTMGQIARRLGVGDPKNPTQIKRWVAATRRFEKTPAGQALLLSPVSSVERGRRYAITSEADLREGVARLNATPARQIEKAAAR
jgi:hypothetical protein